VFLSFPAHAKTSDICSRLGKIATDKYISYKDSIDTMNHWNSKEFPDQWLEAHGESEDKLFLKFVPSLSAYKDMNCEIKLLEEVLSCIEST
jgi:hypothetical protein